MKKMFALLLALVMALTLIACGGKEAPSTETSDKPEASEPAKESKKVEDLTVWSIVPQGYGIFWGNLQEGVKAYCADNGIKNLTVGAPTEISNIQQMIELCEAAVSSKTDILLLRVSDPEAFYDVVNRAVEGGAITHAFQAEPTGLVEDLIPGWTGINPEMLGQAQAQAVIAGVEAGKVAKDATVLYLSPTLTNPTHISNRDNFVSTLSAAYPDMTLITDETGSGNGAPVAAELVDAYFVSNPEISVLVANGANETGVMAAKAEGTGKMDEVYVVGCDGGEEQAEMLYIGSLDCTVCQDTFSVGYKAAENAVKMWQGEEIDFYTPVGSELLFPEGVKEYCENNGFDMTAWNSYKG